MALKPIHMVCVMIFFTTYNNTNASVSEDDCSKKNTRFSRLLQSKDGDILKQIEETLEIMQLDIEQNQHLISTLKTLSDEQKTLNAEYVARLDDQTATLNSHETSLTQATIKISQAESNIRAIDISMTPIGGIVAWSGYNISGGSLPEGWQLCDGSRIDSGPMVNKYTPNLNGGRYFLRGTSSIISSWEYESQMMGDHTHAFSDPGHLHYDDGHTHDYMDFGARYDGYGDDAKDRRHPNMWGTLKTTGNIC